MVAPMSSSMWVALTCSAAVVAQAPAGRFGPAAPVHVVNGAPSARAQMVSVSVPFAPGELPCGPATAGREVVLQAEWTSADDRALVPAVPLLRWRDDSVAVLQVSVRVHVPANGELVGSVRPCLDAAGFGAAASPTPTPSLLPATLPLWTEVEDPWGRIATAALVPDPIAGPDGVLLDDGAVRVQRFRSLHRLPDGSPFLGLRAYLKSFAGERRGELTLLLDNTDACGGGLGPVRFGGFRMVVLDPQLRTLPLFAEENGMAPPTSRPAGGYVQPLLGPARSLYLGDQTAKAFRVELFLDGDELDDAERLAARWAGLPLLAFADVARVRATGAFGAHGGPAPIDAGGNDAAGMQWWQWRQRGDFGPFGGFGEPIADARSGVSRGGDSALHNLLRWRSPQLFLIAEAMVLQQPLRPTPGRNPVFPADMAAYRLGIPRASMLAPHRFTPPDYEHFSVLLLYDWYWLTGDPLARDELARLGRGLVDLLAALPFRTSRGEGCCLQSGALIARATGDRPLAAHLLERCRQQLLPQLPPPERGYCILQPPLPEALGEQPFDAPWQMALLLRGLHALWGATGDPALADGVLRIAHVMAGPGWSEGEGPKYFVSTLDPGRYTMPADAAVKEGVARIAIGSFAVARDLAAAGGDVEAVQLFDRRLQALHELLLRPTANPSERAAVTANPWLQVALDRGMRDEGKR